MAGSHGQSFEAYSEIRFALAAGSGQSQGTLHASNGTCANFTGSTVTNYGTAAVASKTANVKYANDGGSALQANGRITIRRQGLYKIRYEATLLGTTAEAVLARIVKGRVPGYNPVSDSGESTTYADWSNPSALPSDATVSDNGLTGKLRLKHNIECLTWCDPGDWLSVQFTGGTTAPAWEQGVFSVELAG